MTVNSLALVKFADEYCRQESLKVEITELCVSRADIECDWAPRQVGQWTVGAAQP